jgi:hypothetical protein
MTFCLPLLVAASLIADAAAAIGPVVKLANCQLILDGKKIRQVDLEDENGRLYPILGTNRIALLRSGRYRVRSVALEGNYNHAAPSGRIDWLTLRPDRPCHLRAGAPLVPKVEVTRQGRYVRMDYRGIVDAAGRLYFGRGSAELARNHPLCFTVYRDGGEVAAGTLRYGKYG